MEMSLHVWNHLDWDGHGCVTCIKYYTIRYDTIEEFNVDSKAEYSASSSTRSQKKKLKQTAVAVILCVADSSDMSHVTQDCTGASGSANMIMLSKQLLLLFAISY